MATNERNTYCLNFQASNDSDAESLLKAIANHQRIIEDWELLIQYEKSHLNTALKKFKRNFLLSHFGMEKIL